MGGDGIGARTKVTQASGTRGYDHRAVEAKWQAYWSAHETFRTLDDPALPKYYVLDMFPYPSGEGLHVGHPLGYVATDVIARAKRMQGYDVLHPMGWDAFGLPTEQHALATGQHPRAITARNTARFRAQLQALGLSYDWRRELDTSDPGYTRWTQWLFLKLYERGLAYQAELPVNWCPALGTVLADEEVIDGRSERGDHPVERRTMRQWVLKITAYAERLLDDLEDLDWPPGIVAMQRHWIGRSEGAEVRFALDGIGGPDAWGGAGGASGAANAGAAGRADTAGDTGTASSADRAVVAFTTRPETLFGVTYLVLAPEHPLLAEIVPPERRAAVAAYRRAAERKSDFARTELAHEPSGLFSGAYARHPITGERLPIWVADYVLGQYGSGAVMGVPAHDARDGAFASAYGLPVVNVIDETGAMVNSQFLDGCLATDARERLIDWLEAHGCGRRKVTYRLRDWLFSRQRFWGEPFPVLHFADGSVRPLDDDELPLLLPDAADIRPRQEGETPLARVPEWSRITDAKTGRPARRDPNTMPQWAGSCWYYLRYLDPHNDRAPWDLAKAARWLPVDLYVGGAEHAVLHLLYARFWHKVFYDAGLVSTKEPFRRLINQGMILGENGEKMSKSRGNVVNPDAIVASHGADALRIFELFIGPIEATKPWSTAGLQGARRFLDRVWRLYVGPDGRLSPRIAIDQAGGERASDRPEAGGTPSGRAPDGGAKEPNPAFSRLTNQTIRKVGEDIESLRFNTAIAQLMQWLNAAYAEPLIPRPAAEAFVLLLAPFAPHLAEELWQRLGQAESLARAPWPEPVPEATSAQTGADQVEIAVQVDGRLRERLRLPAGADDAAIRRAALAAPKVKAALGGRTVLRVIVVADRLCNVVTRPAEGTHGEV